MRLGFGGKLVGVTLGLVLLLTVGALLAVRREFGKQLRHQAERELRAGSTVLTSILERSGAQLVDRGKVLAELPSLQAALTKNPKDLEPLLVEVKAIRAANLLWATDAAGKILAATGEYPPIGEDLSRQPLIAVALAGQSTLGFDIFDKQWWLMLSLPIRGQSPKKGKEAPQLLGTVSLSLLIGEAYLARLSELMGSQIAFLWGENELWSQGWPEEIRKRVASQTIKALGSRPQDVAFSDGRFLWLARPVTGGNPPIAAGPIALLGIRLDESVITRTSRAIGFVALLIMVIGAFLSIWTVRPLILQLESTQAQLLQAEKLASIGQLAAGVAHELNNPLMVIMGNTQLSLRMLSKMKPSPEMVTELTDLLKALDQETHRSKTIVGNLLDFSRTGAPARIESDIHTLLEDSLKLVEHQATLQSVKVEKDYGKDLPRIKVDPGQIKQVFVNIILNAVQAMPKGGTLRFETGLSQNHLKVAIRDTGTGIPQENLSKVFDPFFTTKEVGAGTGLGLSVSYGIIQHHGGTIEIESEVGRGTAVTLQLPSS